MTQTAKLLSSLLSRPRVRLGLIVVSLVLPSVLAWLVWREAVVPAEGIIHVGRTEVQYVMGTEGGDVVMMYIYPLDSKEQVKDFARAMRQMADQWAALGRTFRVTLAFARPLTPEELRDFVRQHGLTVQYSTALATWPDDSIRDPGQTAAIGLPSEFQKDWRGNSILWHPVPNGNPIDPHSLISATEGRNFIGIVETEVDLDRSTYAVVAGDPRVGAIDVLTQIAIDRARLRYPWTFAGHVFVSSSMLYSAMQQHGLSPSDLSP